MNRYQPSDQSVDRNNPATGYYQPNYQRNYQTSNTFLDELRNFAQERPGFAIAGALLGGFLIARYLLNNEQTVDYRRQENSYRPMWSYAPDQDSAAGRSPANQVERGRAYQPLHNRPADHMGATEDQMSDRFADPSQADLDEGATGTTGTVYEMDPDSITAG